MSKFKFSEQDKQKIKEAVQEAEKKTSGEIVPYFVNKSNDYPEAAYKGGFIVSLFAIVYIVWSSFSWQLSYQLSPWLLSLIIISAFFMGFASTMLLPFMNRIFVSKKRIDKCVRQKALNVFLQEEIFNTWNRTGILIFISFYEQKVEIIGDTLIRNKVADEKWLEVVEIIIQGFKNKQVVDSMINAITMCGNLLEAEGLVKKPDDKNELKDDITIEVL